MKNLKKLLATVTVVGMLGVAGSAFAATAMTPAEVVSGLTGKTVEDLYKERSAGKTYGTIANEAGKLEEFKAQILEQKKTVLDQRVKDGRLTQEQADQIYNSIKNNQATCDGTGSAGIGKKYGAGFGQGSGMGLGQGAGRGAGMRNGGGFGQGMGAGRGMNR
ncbi:hypothetical protein P378_08315 [Desulforamulus profundi]|uniref:DUF2680 domain-containing protein n=1 Tax=Desulforamulus profundi TaxID=1383067 RepID=A0A2C6MH29_9FIRM|nr:DUF2680 domain-containing protein [Desulforamulus profundi]PHJ38716.1 hypothetical protein P378_08315 [Desulforamulus profundi]